MTIVPSIGTRVEALPHRLDRRLVGLVAVALAHRVRAGDRRLLDDAEELEREVGVHVLDCVSLRLAIGRQLAARRLVLAEAEHVVGLHQLVDLARALVDHRALAVAVEAADRILVGVAVGAVDLHGVAGGALGRDGREPLRQAGLARVAAAVVLQRTRRAATAAATPDSRTPSARSSP